MGAADGQPLYFLHIPKTAGTSVSDWLKRRFDDAEVCPPVLLDDLIALAPDELPRYALFCGHFHQYLPSLLGKPLRTVTVLRDPVSRTFSHWRHIVRVAEDPFHARIREQTFDAFVADDANRVIIENYQARHLACSGQPL